jgi:hypothetical protein
MVNQLSHKVVQFLDNDSPHKAIKHRFMKEVRNKF